MRPAISLTFALVSLASAAVAAPAAAPAYHVTGRIAGADGGWDLATVDPVAHRLYVARGDALMAVDLATGKVTDKLVALSRGHGVVVVPGTGQVIATSGGTNTAVVLDGASGKVLATLAVGKNPDAITYDPATRTVWVMNPGSGDISVIDPVALKVVATISVPGALELAAADGQGRLYVNVEDKNEVAVLDTRARKLVTRFPLKGCDGPTGIAWAPDTRQLVSACAGIAAISAPDGKQIAQVKIVDGADGALYDTTRHVALIPGGRSGALSVVRLGANPMEIAQVATATSARTAALDSSTGVVYLPSAKTGAPATPGGRPSITPGTFAVVTVSP